MRSYSKDDKCLALMHLNDGSKDLMLLVLDSDGSIMNLDPGSKLLMNLSDLKTARGVYICSKSQLKHLGGIVYELKQANDIAKEAYLLRKMCLYNKNKSEDGPPKFKPLQLYPSQSHNTTDLPKSNISAKPHSDNAKKNMSSTNRSATRPTKISDSRIAKNDNTHGRDKNKPRNKLTTKQNTNNYANTNTENNTTKSGVKKK